MAWYSAGLTVNPVLGAVLADTGPSVGSDTRGEAFVVMTSTVAGLFVVEHVAADGQTILHNHTFFLIANGMANPRLLVDLALGERLRVKCPVALLGQCQASIFSSVHVGGANG